MGCQDSPRGHMTRCAGKRSKEVGIGEIVKLTAVEIIDGVIDLGLQIGDLVGDVGVIFFDECVRCFFEIEDAFFLFGAQFSEGFNDNALIFLNFGQLRLNGEHDFDERLRAGFGVSIEESGEDGRLGRRHDIPYEWLD